MIRTSSRMVTGQVATGASALAVANRGGRLSIILKNADATNGIYIGVSGVASTDGFLLAAGQTIEIQTNSAIYALAAAGTPRLHYIELL